MDPDASNDAYCSSDAGGFDTCMGAGSDSGDSDNGGDYPG